MKIFGERLKELRNEKGLTQDELAKEIGVARNSIFSYETDRRSPDIDVLVKCAEFFGVTSDYLVGLSDNRTTENAAISIDLGLNDEALEYLKIFVNCRKVIDTLNDNEKIDFENYLNSKEARKKEFEGYAYLIKKGAINSIYPFVDTIADFNYVKRAVSEYYTGLDIGTENEKYNSIIAELTAITLLVCEGGYFSNNDPVAYYEDNVNDHFYDIKSIYYDLVNVVDKSIDLLLTKYSLLHTIGNYFYGEISDKNFVELIEIFIKEKRSIDWSKFMIEEKIICQRK